MSAAFFAELAAARAARRPMVWRRPFGRAAPQSDELFTWLSDAWRDAEPRARLRLYAPEGLVPAAAEHAPLPADGSMRGWLARLERAHGECGVVVNDVQGATPAAWRFARRLLGGLRGSGGPFHGASIDAFAGAYRRGAFGVHKDDQDVVTLVLEGKKRFRLWPYEQLAGRPEVPAGSELAQVGLTLAAGEEPPALLRLEGEPGDVFYWPAEWWHVAESDRELCATLGVGLFRTPRPAPADAARAEEHAVALASAFGCHVAPPPGDTPLDLDAPARAVRGAVVTRTSRDGDLVWGVGGEVFRYPALRPLVELLRRVAGGAPFVPGALIETLADDDVAPDALAHVLELIHAHHGLVARGDAWNLHVVPGPGAPRRAAHDDSSASFHSAASR